MMIRFLSPFHSLVTLVRDIALLAAIFVLLASLHAVWAHAQPAAPIDVLRVERIELVDSNGDVRGVLGMYDDAIGFTVLDDSGESRARIGVALDGTPVIGIRDHDGRSSVGLGIKSDGAAMLAASEQEAGAVVLGAGSGATGLSIQDADGRVRAVLQLESDGIVHVQLDDGKNMPSEKPTEPGS
jgi:hypothetical protein